MVAIDRPPFGLSQRPRTWEGGEQGSPYTNEVLFRHAWDKPRIASPQGVDHMRTRAWLCWPWEAPTCTGPERYLLTWVNHHTFKSW